MKVDYHIFPDEGLLVQQFRENYCMDTYIKFIHQLIKDPNWPKVNKALVDLRGMELNVEFNKVYKLAEVRTTILQKNCRTVILVDQPVATASAVVYVDLLRNNGYDYHLGSTLECALGLLHANDKKFEIESFLNQFSKSTLIS